MQLHSKMRGRRGRRPSREGDFEAAQVEALAALVGAMSPQKKLDDVVGTLVRHVLVRSGTKAFSQDLAVEAAGLALQGKGQPTLTREMDPHVETAAAMPLVMDALHTLGQRSGMHFNDMLGQILWHHRKDEVLQERRFHKTVEDTAWAFDAAGDPDARLSKMGSVESVFRAMTSPDGQMYLRQWRKVAELVQRSPLLQGRVKRLEVDYVFHASCGRGNVAQRHVNDSCHAINYEAFTALLVELADVMRVHPFMVFVAVGCHAQHLLDNSNNPKRPRSAH